MSVAKKRINSANALSAGENMKPDSNTQSPAKFNNDSQSDVLVPKIDFGGIIQQSLDKFYRELDGNDAPFKLIDHTVVTVFNPTESKIIRNSLNITPESYMSSICGGRFIEFENQGQSGAYFFRSHDDVYFIKTVSKQESKFLKSFTKTYSEEIVKKNKHSFLTKICEHFKIRLKGRSTYFVIMNNLFAELKCTRKYDLKGSQKNRKAKLKGDSVVLKDKNFIEDYPMPIEIDEDSFKRIIEILENDTATLRALKVVDYSLLLGIRYVDKDESGNLPSVKMVVGNKEDSIIDLSDNSDDSSSKKFTSSVATKSSTKDQIFIPPGSVLAKDRNNKGDRRMILHMQIIDMLIEYKLFKQSEYHFKSFLKKFEAKKEEFSVVPPEKYQKRFMHFVQDKIFKSVNKANDDWIHFSTKTLKYVGNVSTNSEEFIKYMSACRKNHPEETQASSKN